MYKTLKIITLKSQRILVQWMFKCSWRSRRTLELTKQFYFPIFSALPEKKIFATNVTMFRTLASDGGWLKGKCMWRLAICFCSDSSKKIRKYRKLFCCDENTQKHWNESMNDSLGDMGSGDNGMWKWWDKVDIDKKCVMLRWQYK